VATGVVREWWVEDGWGVIDCDETPGGCWAHFSMIQMDGFRSLAAGDLVDLDWIEVDQDGYRYRAERLRKIPTS
jgi:CspA family cold shock protein